MLWPGWRDVRNGLLQRPDGAMVREAPPPYPGPAGGLRIIVCGGRDYAASARVWAALHALHYRPGRPITTLVHGDCRDRRTGEPAGADRWAAEWARAMGVTVEPHPADWSALGPAAGPIRNAVMAEAGADGVVAFPGGRGTTSMCMEAEQRGIPVWRPWG